MQGGVYCNRHKMKRVVMGRRSSTTSGICTGSGSSKLLPVCDNSGYQVCWSPILSFASCWCPLSVLAARSRPPVPFPLAAPLIVWLPHTEAPHAFHASCAAGEILVQNNLLRRVPRSDRAHAMSQGYRGLRLVVTKVPPMGRHRHVRLGVLCFCS